MDRRRCGPASRPLRRRDADRGLLDGDLATALSGCALDLVVIATWIRCVTEAEMVNVSGAVLRRLFAALRSARRTRHVALVTGLKHYLGSFEAYGSGRVPPTPFRESQGGLDVANFY